MTHTKEEIVKLEKALFYHAPFYLCYLDKTWTLLTYVERFNLKFKKKFAEYRVDPLNYKEPKSLARFLTARKKDAEKITH